MTSEVPAEATWVLQVREFGPFFVAIDAHGQNYFENMQVDIEKRMPEINATLGIPSNYAFTEVNSSNTGK